MGKAKENQICSDFMKKITECAMNLLINTDANDMGSFQAIVEKYKQMYDEYPRIICADAVYGSKKNYSCCGRNNIIAYIKYPSFEKEQKKNREKEVQNSTVDRDENQGSNRRKRRSRQKKQKIKIRQE